MRALARLTLRLCLGLALALGWIAFAGVVTLWLAEETGLLRRAVVSALRRDAGTLAADLEVQNVRLRWFEPALELEGVQIGHAGELAFLRHVDVHFRFARERGFEPAGIEAWDGHVRITPALLNAFEGFSRQLGPPAQGEARPAATPSVRIDDVSVEWETRRFGRIPLGRVALELVDEPGTGVVLNGRVVPGAVAGASTAARGEITLRGRPSGSGSFDVEAWARAVPLGPEMLPQSGAVAGLARHKARGTLDLSAQAHFAFDGSALPSATLRARIAGGSGELLGGDVVADELDLEVDARYAPARSEEIWAPRSWTARAHARGRLNEARSEAWFVLGPEAGQGRLAKLWCSAPELALKTVLGEMHTLPAEVVQRWRAFEPRGIARVHAALEVPIDWNLDEELGSRARFALDARLDGRGGMTYHGWPNHADGHSDQGFPLPIDKVRGEVGYALDPRAPRPFRIALFDLEGEHPGGPIHAHGSVEAHPSDLPPTAPGHGYSDLDLTLSTPKLAVDEYLDRALLGLSGTLPPGSTWKPYEPRHGELAIDLHLVREPHMHWLSTDLAVGMRGLDLVWKEREPAIPASLSNGTLRYRSDGVRQAGLSFVGQGRLETAQSLSIVLRAQFDPTATDDARARDLDELAWIAADVKRISLKGEDVQRLARRHPEIGASLAPITRQGFVDARYTRARTGLHEHFASYFEVAPNAETPVALQFEKFPMLTSDVRGGVRGAVLDEKGGGSRTRLAIAPLVGRWEKEAQVAIRAAFPGRVVSVHGVGIDPSSAKLRGSLRALLDQSGGSGGGAAADISTASLSGRVDLRGDITLSESSGAADHSRFRFHLRNNTFESGKSFRLDELHGVLTLVDEEAGGKRVELLRGGRIDAALAGTPVVLSNTTLRAATENDSDPGGSGGLQFDTDIAASGVPLDKAHLAPFFDANTLDALLGELKWSGTLDVPQGHVTLKAPSIGEGALVFRGDVVPHDMSIVLGMPLFVEKANARIEELIYEGGRVRAFASVGDFSGTVAGRRLDDASLLVTYVEPRLSIEDLKGKFARGDVRPLGVESDRGGTLFSIDLSEPYPFQLALDLRDVRLEDLLQGLFVSNVASKGRLDCNLLLRGDTKNLLAIEGAGSVRVRDSYLWSIPVFRGLLSRFGLGNAVVFDQLATNITIHDGRIEMRDLNVRSDVLQLAGQGSLDFDGTLDYELDARLTEIKTLDWILRALSFITDNIVSVTISGDLDRPEINAHWFNLFGGDDRFRALPLPGYAPLPPRF